MVPKRIIIEKDCIDFPIAKRLKQMFLHSKSIIYREVNTSGENSSIPYKSLDTISQMKSTLIVARSKGFCIEKVGEGTTNPACDYEIEFIYGCPHQCVFCQQIYSLQETPYIAIYPDVQRIFQDVRNIIQKAKKIPVIFEAGNMTDLLGLEPITGFLKEMILFWANELDFKARLHFLTRSNNVQEILRLDHKGMTRVGFSINLSEFNKKYELRSAAIDERLQAIGSVLKNGYRLHLSFSPIIYREGILSKYEELFQKIKTFLLTCDGFDESDLNIEALIFFQKRGGEHQIHQHYPKVVGELMQYFEYRRLGSYVRYCYPQHIYDNLLPFLKHCLDTYFPNAKVLFIA